MYNASVQETITRLSGWLPSLPGLARAVERQHGLHMFKRDEFLGRVGDASS